MTDVEKLAKKQKSKARGRKIAEIIWLSVGGALALCGITCLVLSVIINNIGSNEGVMYHSPFYGLIEAQTNFKEWWNSWFFWQMTSFGGLGTWLLIFACAYELIVLGVYALKEDANEKKEKARKLRERNARKFKEEQDANVAAMEAAKAAEEAKKANEEVPATEPVSQN